MIVLCFKLVYFAFRHGTKVGNNISNETGGLKSDSWFNFQH